MADALTRLLLFLALFVAGEIHVTFSLTDACDAAVLASLKAAWQNTPPSWNSTFDPCGGRWEGVTCNNNSGRVTALALSSLNLAGYLSDDIGNLTELRSLDLSFNRNLTGSLTPRLGDLQYLSILILTGCGLSGNIPGEIGNLARLTFLALNSNFFSGAIPPSLGKLSKLYWLDLADNQLTGILPVSTATAPGLDLLINAKHFHLQKNQLSGFIPPKLFSSDMKLVHLILNSNQLSRSIPSTLGLVQTLEVIRLDQNALTAEVPPSLGNLVNLNELNLAGNYLTGALPNVTKMDSLNYLDLSNNYFDTSQSLNWLPKLPSSITILAVENGSLQGPLPPQILGLPQLQRVLLGNNRIDGVLEITGNVSSQLQLLDLQNNQISSFSVKNYTFELSLIGNPVCEAMPNSRYCQPRQNLTKPYSTSLANCNGSIQCPAQEKLSPGNCQCAFPYEGSMFFRAPAFRDVSNATAFHSLETSLRGNLSLSPGSVFLQNPFFNTYNYLQLQVALFPASGKYFNRSEIERIGYELANQTYKPPQVFGPYYYIASPYPFPGNLTQMIF